MRPLGPAGSTDTEVEAVLVENTITVAPFSERLLASLPTNTPDRPWAVTPVRQRRPRLNRAAGGLSRSHGCGPPRGGCLR